MRALLLIALLAITASAQTPAKPEENARIAPLVAAEKKAREDLNTRMAALPEMKAYQTAQEALKKAAEALNAAVEKLPENTVLKEASARTLDEAYRIQATHALSSREYQPQLNDKGELVFARIAPPKPQP